MFSKHLLTVSTIFIAIFLMVAAINTQPILSPKSASADPPPGRGPACPTGSSFNFSTERCEAQPTCPSGAPPNSQGQCTTTTVVGPGTCPITPTLSLQIIQTSSGYVCGTGLPSFEGSTCPAGTSLDGIAIFNGRQVCVSNSQPSPCPSGQFNPSTRKCEVTTTTLATCPQGTTLSGDVCVAHPIPKGPKPG